MYIRIENVLLMRKTFLFRFFTFPSLAVFLVCEKNYLTLSLYASIANTAYLICFFFLYILFCWITSNDFQVKFVNAQTCDCLRPISDTTRFISSQTEALPLYALFFFLFLFFSFHIFNM